MEAMQLFENDDFKFIDSPNFHMRFNKHDGYTITWGETTEENPEYCEYGPLIVDFEVTTICGGPGNLGPCQFCYKSNTTKGINTSFDDFVTVFNKLPKTVTQIAFGVDAKAQSNPDLFNMMWYCRNNGVIPNVTVADVSPYTAERLAAVCGAVAVSRYADKRLCYNSIKQLKLAAKQQGRDLDVNIHILVSEETEDWIWETFKDYQKGKIKGLNAIVLLSLKQKGRGKFFNVLSFEKYSKIINYALDNNIPIGADSCSGSKFIKSIKGHKDYNKIYEMIEPCESGLFSIFINAKCEVHPCSFAEEKGKHGISLLEDNTFEQVWFSQQIKDFREANINSKDENECRQCILFEV